MNPLDINLNYSEDENPLALKSDFVLSFCELVMGGKNGLEPIEKLGMLIVQDQIWGRVTANRREGRAAWYFADEFHLLLKEEQTAAYSAEIWKRFRKWGGIPTGATQNVKDLLFSPEIENILENSDFITLLNQASGDRKILADNPQLVAGLKALITS